MTEILIIVAAITVGAFVKGVTGSGLPQIAIPVMAGFLGIERAVVVMSIPVLLSNTWLMWQFRSHLSSTRDLPVLLATGIGGAVAGTWLLKEIDPRILSAVLASLILAYILLLLTKPDFHLKPSTTRVLSPPIGLAAGTLQGATGISGPLVTTYLHSFRLDPPVYVVSVVTVFQVFGVAQGITLAGLGLFTANRLQEGLLAIVPMAIALPLGARLAKTISRRAFDVWVLVLLVASAAKLVHSAVWG